MSSWGWLEKGMEEAAWHLLSELGESHGREAGRIGIQWNFTPKAATLQLHKKPNKAQNNPFPSITTLLKAARAWRLIKTLLQTALV